jgi:hypothetical protein
VKKGSKLELDSLKFSSLPFSFTSKLGDGKYFLE